MPSAASQMAPRHPPRCLPVGVRLSDSNRSRMGGNTSERPGITRPSCAPSGGNSCVRTADARGRSPRIPATSRAEQERSTSIQMHRIGRLSKCGTVSSKKPPWNSTAPSSPKVSTFAQDLAEGPAEIPGEVAGVIRSGQPGERVEDLHRDAEVVAAEAQAGGAEALEAAEFEEMAVEAIALQDIEVVGDNQHLRRGGGDRDAGPSRRGPRPH